jgi:signal transduction histidine kinase
MARVLTANDTAMAMSGASTPDDLFTWLRERYTNEAAVAYIRAAAPLLMGDVRVVDIELPLLTPDGKRIDLLQRLARQPNWNTQPRLIAIVLDVTERNRTQRDLEHRKQILEEAEVLARIGSWESDPSGRLYGSAGFWRIFEGRAKARYASREEVYRCFREDYRPIAAEIIESVRRIGRKPEGENREMVIVHPDGTTVIQRGASFAERNEAGELVRLFGVVQDVTEQRRMEEAAQREREALTRADKMISLGVLVSGVAHEVNNPNHAIMLNMSLLRDAWRGIAPIVDEYAAREGNVRIANLAWDELRGEVASLIDDVEHAAERIRGIVTELRSFALDPDPGERRAVSMNDVVTSSLRLLGNHVRKATTRFSVTLAPDLPSVEGNPRRLEQVLVNLVINACQALENTECAISIETGKTATHVFARVTDEGRGISRDDLRKITEPFFTTKRASGGSGLGLAVSERIAQEHGGTLTFESEPGRGTTATLSIPRILSI